MITVYAYAFIRARTAVLARFHRKTARPQRVCAARRSGAVDHGRGGDTENQNPQNWRDRVFGGAGTGGGWVDGAAGGR